MDQRKQREIASKGGQAAHQKGTAHEFTSDEARAAGRKGGEAVSSNRAHMSAIGRKGGESSHGGQKANGHASMPDSGMDGERAEAASNGHEKSDNGNTNGGNGTNGGSANGDGRDHVSVEAGQDLRRD
jgi:general stress protein YciG